MKYQPLADRVLVRPSEAEETTASGIILAEAAREKPQSGTVVAVGEGRIENGERIPVSVKEGCEVVYSKYGGTEIKVDDEELLLLRESDLLAVRVE